MVTDPAVLCPTLLGLVCLVAGVMTWRPDAQPVAAREAFGLAAYGPALIAGALAAFAGEHFTAATSLAELVPKWLPARLFIVYLVGAAHLAAALSIVARRYVRWSALGLGVMFALFVLLMDLPAAFAHPANRMDWILAARETTFAMGGVALFVISASGRGWPDSTTLANIVRIWTAGVLVFYGIGHVLHPQFSPGVPATMLTASWVPLPRLLAYGTGVALIACGAAMLVPRLASSGAALAGLSMVLLTLLLYVPQWFLARTVRERVTALNFVFDTLLFGGTLLVISRAVTHAVSALGARRGNVSGMPIDVTSAITSDITMN